MSVIIFDRVRFEHEAPAQQAVATGRKCGREEEFRSALERYMAEYVDCQRRRAAAAPASSSEFFETFARWLQAARSVFATNKTSR